MYRVSKILLVVTIASSLFLPAKVRGQACLHGADESQQQRERRTAAIRMAREINTLQVRVHQQDGRYVSSDQLGLVTRAPEFELTLSTNGEQYLFVLEDSLDPCQYALFSSDKGLIREGTSLKPLDPQGRTR